MAKNDKSAKIDKVANIDKTPKRIGVLEIPSFYLNYRARRNGEEYRSVSVDTEKALKELNKKR